MEYTGAREQVTKELSGDQPGPGATTDRQHPVATPASPPICRAGDEAECPQCACAMRLWAGFYRCPNCGYKQSCCF